MKILVINPGSTSTKLAVFEDRDMLFSQTVEHSKEELMPFATISDQLSFRENLVREAIREHGLTPKDFAAIAGRGGPVAPLQSGAYKVNEALVDRLLHHPMNEHASNLAGVIAYRIAQEAGISAYIYDAVSTDEMVDFARITGLKEINRKAAVHTLNMRANVLNLCEEKGWDFHEKNILAIHMGGGTSLSMFEKGRMVDIIGDDEGPFSPERSGGAPLRQFVPAFMGEAEAVLMKRLRSQGGLMSHFGTTDVREVERLAQEGDEHAAMVLEAMMYRIAFAAGGLATMVNGQVDAIIMMGGIAHSQTLMKKLEDRISFIAPCYIRPGEIELQALAYGVLRVLLGEEQARSFEG